MSDIYTITNEEAIDMFLDDVSDIYSKIEDVLDNACDENYINADEMQMIMGYYHTLKGNASMIEATNYTTLIHNLETYFGKINKNIEEYGEEFLDLLYDTSDVTKHIAIQEANNNLCNNYFTKSSEELLSKYQNILK
jgi:chemotaxis protein histidine kinase CheA